MAHSVHTAAPPFVAVYVPAGQPTQADRSRFRVPLLPPTRHETQAVAPVRRPVWAVAAHAVQLDWPVKAWAVLAAQGAHAARPLAAAYEPAGHGAHVEAASAGCTWPGAHSVHDVAPVVARNEPAAHGEHAETLPP